MQRVCVLCLAIGARFGFTLSNAGIALAMVAFAAAAPLR